jgi:D-alanine-D-alanine ligase-like ATP-grasp enzyme
LEEHILSRIKDIIIDTFQSVKTQLNPNRRENVFELFGYDFIIDEDFWVWLLEVNTNPYLGMPNEYMKKLVP